MKKHRTSMRNLTVGLAAMGLMIALAGPASAYPRPGRTERVSVAGDGAEANSWAGLPAVSADGRYVAFYSNASNLVPGDTNDVEDLFVRDRVTGTTERASVASDGSQADAQFGSMFGFPAISADGRFAVFTSYASNLVPGDTNNTRDVFVHDRVTGKTERVSVASDGAEANGYNGSGWPAISADGRYVAFNSSASNLVPEDSARNWDIFVHDRDTGTTERVSVGSDGAETFVDSGAPSLSADGRYVVFDSTAGTTLDPADTNGLWDVFLHDRETGKTERVSVGTNGEQGNASVGPPRQLAVSADGRYVTFSAFADNFVPSDTNFAGDVFVHDRVTDRTERVSVSSDGTQANSHSGLPSMSADGRFVTFESIASNLVPGDTNNDWDIFVHDRTTGVTERVSVAGDGAQSNGLSMFFAIGQDGRHVAYNSLASNLVPGDTNATTDIFVRDRGRPIGVGELSAIPDGDRITVSGRATFAGAAVASASDPPDDGTEGAAEVGAELTGAELTYRPEQEDLFLRLRLSSVPRSPVPCATVTCVPTRVGVPPVLYGLRFQLGATTYEVRALRVGGTAAPPATPYFALFRCAPTCTETARLNGGIGTTAPEMVTSVPLAALGAQEGAALTGIRAFTAVGEAAPGAAVTLDQADLADAAIPGRSVALGIAPAGSPESEVDFDTQAGLTDGSFAGTLPASPPGDYDVWARACLGTTCGSAKTLITVG